MASNAQIAAVSAAASHYDRIAALEYRVAALEAQLRRVETRRTLNEALLHLMADGAEWTAAELAKRAGYARSYVESGLSLMTRSGHITRVRRGVYRIGG